MKRCALCVLIVSVVLSGCYDRIEMEDRNYVITLGIDQYTQEIGSKQEETNLPNRYTVSLASAQLSSDTKNNNGQSQEKDSSAVEVISGTTLSETLRIGDKYSNKASYYGQLKTAIMGEELLKDRQLFIDTIETMEKNNEINGSVIILGCQGTAFDVMDKITRDNSSAGLYIWDFYKSSGKNQEIEILNIQQIQRAFTEGEAIFIPMIYEKDGGIIIDGGMILKDYKLEAILNDVENQGAHWVMGRGKNKILQVYCEDRYISAKVLDSSSEMTYTQENGRLVCNVVIDGKLQLIGHQYSDESVIKQQYTDLIINQVNEAIAIGIEKDCDYLEINSNLKWKYPKLYSQYNGKAQNIRTIVNLEVEYRQ